MGLSFLEPMVHPSFLVASSFLAGLASAFLAGLTSASFQVVLALASCLVNPSFRAILASSYHLAFASEVVAVIEDLAATLCP